MKLHSRTFSRRMYRGFRYGSATFRHGMVEPGAPALSLDETLTQIERELARQERAKIRAAEAPPAPPSKRRIFAAANMIAASPASKARVKLPVFSIQQD